MSAAKMTPGPWTVCKAYSNEFTKRVPIKTGSAPAQTIIETLGAPKGDVAEANARAIATLPELVEAARAMVALWPEREDGSIKATPDVIMARNGLRRILARIDGEDA